MLARQRQTRIADELRRAGGGVRVSELTTLLGVSDMTIRRDLDRLVADGVAPKVHGGAVLPGHVTEEPGFEAKRELAQPAKQVIAAAAARLIRPRTAIGLSAGTTTWALSPYLADIDGLTIVTNSTTVADTIAALPGSSRRTVILTGGVRTPIAALVGPIADIAIRAIYVDQLFLGVHGMAAHAGYTSPNLAEAQTNKELISRALQVVVLADSSKWGAVGLAGFGPLSTADVLITDDGLPPDAIAYPRETVGELICVSATAAEAASRPVSRACGWPTAAS